MNSFHFASQTKGMTQSIDFQELLESLPKKKGWRTAYMYQYQGFWYSAEALESALAAQKHFQPRDTDIILATAPKSGTTWLKSLVFVIANRTRYSIHDQNHPLLTTNPHGLVPFLEILYLDKIVLSEEISNLDPPRSFSTHVDCSMLSESIKTSNCKIIYLCRNPKDVFVSLWLFINKIKPSSLEKLSLDEAFELFCDGVTPMGPYWVQALSYWKWSLEKPNKVLFLKYEDMKEDIGSQIMKISEFLGCPFSSREQSEGAVQQIEKLCCFESLSNLDVNKNGGERPITFVDNKEFFRKGEVGDWMNYLTSSMAERLDQIINETLHGSGLSIN
ncbi:hydroxyjasmonate sulfotransferase [Ranunculus cassubicifolius]